MSYDATSRAAACTADDLARGHSAIGSDSVAEGRDGTGAIARVGSGAELRRHGLSPPRREWGSRPVVAVVTPDGVRPSTTNPRVGGSTANPRVGGTTANPRVGGTTANPK